MKSATFIETIPGLVSQPSNEKLLVDVRVSYPPSFKHTTRLCLLLRLSPFLRSTVDYSSCSLNSYRSRLILLRAEIMTHLLVTIWPIMFDARLHDDVHR